MNIGSSDKALFVQGPYLLYRLILAVILSVILLFVDTSFSVLDPVRRVIGSALTPVYWLSSVPENIAEGTSNLFRSRGSLEEELDKMRSQMLVLERKAQNWRLLPPN